MWSRTSSTFWLLAAPALSRYLTVSRWLFSHAYISGVLWPSSHMSRLAPACGDRTWCCFWLPSHQHRQHTQVSVATFSYIVQTGKASHFSVLANHHRKKTCSTNYMNKRIWRLNNKKRLHEGQQKYLNKHVADLNMASPCRNMQGCLPLGAVQCSIGVCPFNCSEQMKIPDIHAPDVWYCTCSATHGRNLYSVLWPAALYWIISKGCMTAVHPY